MRFVDVPGQAVVKENLLGMISHNRLSHALLFLGKEGSGALQLAIALAQYLVCEKNTGNSVEADSCGTCPSCKKANALIHPDIHYSFPTITAKNIDKPKCSDFITEWRSFVAQLPYGNAYDWLQSLSTENKQGNITVHECEDIIRKLNLKSFESGYKILIQWMPEYLGAAGNKLLKLIEEPPANTLFIFVAEEEARILPTILSRTQMVKINRLETREIQDWLVTNQSVPREKAEQVAPMAQGNMREALQLLRDADEDWQEILRDWLNAILKNGPAAQAKWVEETSKLGREKHKQFLAYFIHLLSGSVHLAHLGNADELPEKEKDFAVRLLKLASTEQLQAVVNELDKCIYYIERNANPKMLFMALTIKIYHIIQDKSVISIH